MQEPNESDKGLKNDVVVPKNIPETSQTPKIANENPNLASKKSQKSRGINLLLIQSHDTNDYGAIVHTKGDSTVQHPSQTMNTQLSLQGMQKLRLGEIVGSSAEALTPKHLNAELIKVNNKQIDEHEQGNLRRSYINVSEGKKVLSNDEFSDNSNSLEPIVAAGVEANNQDINPSLQQKKDGMNNVSLRLRDALPKLDNIEKSANQFKYGKKLKNQEKPLHRQQLSVSQIKRPFKQQRTAVTKSSILRVKQDLDLADQQLQQIQPLMSSHEQNEDLATQQQQHVIQYNQQWVPGQQHQHHQFFVYNQPGLGINFCNSNMTFAQHQNVTSSHGQHTLEMSASNMDPVSPNFASTFQQQLHQEHILSKFQMQTQDLFKKTVDSSGRPTHAFNSRHRVSEAEIRSSSHARLASQYSEQMCTSIMHQKAPDARYPSEMQLIDANEMIQSQVTMLSKNVSRGQMQSKRSAMMHLSGHSELTPNHSRQNQRLLSGYVRNMTPNDPGNAMHIISHPNNEICKVNSQGIIKLGPQIIEPVPKIINRETTYGIEQVSTAVYNSKVATINKDLDMVEASAKQMETHAVRSSANQKFGMPAHMAHFVKTTNNVKNSARNTNLSGSRANYHQNIDQPRKSASTALRQSLTATKRDTYNNTKAAISNTQSTNEKKRSCSPSWRQQQKNNSSMRKASVIKMHKNMTTPKQDLSGNPKVSVKIGQKSLELDKIETVQTKRKNSLDVVRMETLEPKEIIQYINQNLLDQDIKEIQQPEIALQQKRKLEIQVDIQANADLAQPESMLYSPQLKTSQTNLSNKQFLDSISKRESQNCGKSSFVSQRHSVSPTATNRRKHQTCSPVNSNHEKRQQTASQFAAQKVRGQSQAGSDLDNIVDQQLRSRNAQTKLNDGSKTANDKSLGPIIKYCEQHQQEPTISSINSIKQESKENTDEEKSRFFLKLDSKQPTSNDKTPDLNETTEFSENFSKAYKQVQSSILRNFDNFKQLLNTSNESQKEQILLSKVQNDAFNSQNTNSYEQNKTHYLGQENSFETGSTLQQVSRYPTSQTIGDLATALEKFKKAFHEKKIGSVNQQQQQDQPSTKEIIPDHLRQQSDQGFLQAINSGPNVTINRLKRPQSHQKSAKVWNMKRNQMIHQHRMGNNSNLTMTMPVRPNTNHMVQRMRNASQIELQEPFLISQQLNPSKKSIAEHILDQRSNQTNNNTKTNSTILGQQLNQHLNQKGNLAARDSINCVDKLENESLIIKKLQSSRMKSAAAPYHSKNPASGQRISILPKQSCIAERRLSNDAGTNTNKNVAASPSSNVKKSITSGQLKNNVDTQKQTSVMHSEQERVQIPDAIQETYASDCGSRESLLIQNHQLGSPGVRSPINIIDRGSQYKDVRIFEDVVSELQSQKEESSPKALISKAAKFELGEIPISRFDVMSYKSHVVTQRKKAQSTFSKIQDYRNEKKPNQVQPKRSLLSRTANISSACRGGKNDNIQFKKLPSHLQQKYVELFRPKEIQDMLLTDTFQLQSSRPETQTKISFLSQKSTRQGGVQSPQNIMMSKRTNNRRPQTQASGKFRKQKVVMGQPNMINLLKNVNFFRAEKQLMHQKGIRMNERISNSLISQSPTDNIFIDEPKTVTSSMIKNSSQ